jgi:DNA mismatch endonuclease (patch repair protein)
MSKIRSNETTPEISLRKELWKMGLRYRKNYKLTGKPDIVFIGKKIAVFVDGCFWHKCPKCYREPKSNKEYWIPKIEYNVDKDMKVNNQLESDGWKVLRFWEHEVIKDIDSCLNAIMELFQKS